jgi:cobalt-zinc-cadmium efflux system protein
MTRHGQQRALLIAIVINGAYLVVEVAGGVIFNSLALLADAGHMLSDVGALAIALIAHRLMARPATARHTYGLQRAEVVGGFFSAVSLAIVVVWIVVEALGRLRHPEDVAGGGLLAVAGIGLIVNILSAAMLARSKGSSLNMQAAFLHMAADAAGSVAVIVAAMGVIIWGVTWVDPVASILIGALILWAAAKVIKNTLHVLLEGSPRGMDAEEVERSMRQFEGVDGVHHLHLWNLASDVPALSAHVVLEGELDLHDAQQRGDRIKTMLAQRFGIEHATLELECHACEPQTQGAGRNV